MKPTLEIDVIEKYISQLKKDPTHRYGSWDNCFTAFSNSNEPDILPLHLGFYLASWGMYRGSGGLLQKNHFVHTGAVGILRSKQYQQLKCGDAKEVNKNSVTSILELKKVLADYYKSKNFTGKRGPKSISDTDTLLSKILLGTLACTPAYDRYFIAGLKKMNMSHTKFNESSLNELFEFIEENESEIKKVQDWIKQETKGHYPFMKILDMYFWQIGFDDESNK